MKKVAFFDIDKTIYDTHSFFQIVENEVSLDRIKKGTWLMVQNLLAEYKLGNSTYTQTANKLLESIVYDLKGQKFSDLLQDVTEFFLNNKQNFFPYFEAILPKLKQSHDIYISLQQMHSL